MGWDGNGNGNGDRMGWDGMGMAWHGMGMGMEMPQPPLLPSLRALPALGLLLLSPSLALVLERSGQQWDAGKCLIPPGDASQGHPQGFVCPCPPQNQLHNPNPAEGSLEN